MTIEQTLKLYQQRIETKLSALLPSEEDEPKRLHSAMRYAVLGGGKRIRAALVYASGDAFKLDLEPLDAIACAVECIHAYSLVHDDLPAMDDDDLRRGQPSCHKAYDEATAILVGDALQALAFECLTNAKTIPAEQTVKLIRSLSQATGSRGMVGGQSLDLEATAQQISNDELTTLHELKTGALLESCVLMPAIVAGIDHGEQFQQLSSYAKNIGLAFQIQDDILDVTASTEQLGKAQGSDDRNQKTTFITHYGQEGAKEALQHCLQVAREAISSLGQSGQNLKAIAEFICHRHY